MRVAVDGWKLAVKAIVSLPGLFASGLLVLVLWELLARRVGIGRVLVADTGSIAFFQALPGQIVDTLVSASVAIAVHRFVVLNEIVDRPIWRVPGSFRRFVAWLLAVDVLMDLPNQAIQAVRPSGLYLALWIDFAYVAFSGYVSLRLLLIFPAIATASHGTDWRKAWNVMRGRSWRIFWVGFWSMLPLVLLLLAWLAALER